MVTPPIETAEKHAGGDSSGASEGALRRESGAVVRRAVEQLSDRERLVLRWRIEERLPFGEMGRRLGCSEVAARNVWATAIERLATELQQILADSARTDGRP